MQEVCQQLQNFLTSPFRVLPLISFVWTEVSRNEGFYVPYLITSTDLLTRTCRRIARYLHQSFAKEMFNIFLSENICFLCVL